MWFWCSQECSIPNAKATLDLGEKALLPGSMHKTCSRRTSVSVLSTHKLRLHLGQNTFSDRAGILSASVVNGSCPYSPIASCSQEPGRSPQLWLAGAGRRALSPAAPPLWVAHVSGCPKPGIAGTGLQERGALDHTSQCGLRSQSSTDPVHQCMIFIPSAWLLGVME